MNTTVANPIKQIKDKSILVSKLSNIINTLGIDKKSDENYSFSDYIFYLLKASANSDQKSKNKIENHLVNLGEAVVPTLINNLTKTQGPTRGMIAMILIRIGTPSIKHLENVSNLNPEVKWIYDYIKEEIKGTQVKLKNRLSEENNLEKVLVS